MTEKRFEGLSREQIRDLLIIEAKVKELLRWGPTRKSLADLPKVRAMYAEAGIPYTVEQARAYVSTRAFPCWNYLWCVEMASLGETGPLLTLLLDLGLIKEAIERLGPSVVDPKTLRAMGMMHLGLMLTQRQQHPLFEREMLDHIGEAYAAFQACGSKVGLYGVRRTAIACGRAAMASEISEQLGMPLTAKNTEKIARAMIDRRHPIKVIEAYVAEHRLDPLYAYWVARALRGWEGVNYSYSAIREFAQRHDVEITRPQLEARVVREPFAAHGREGVLLLTDLLEVLPKGKRRRRIELLLRNALLNEGDVDKADEIGRMIGQPLTTAELTYLYERFFDGASPDNKKAKRVLDLAAARA